MVGIGGRPGPEAALAGAGVGADRGRVRGRAGRRREWDDIPRPAKDGGGGRRGARYRPAKAYPGGGAK